MKESARILSWKSKTERDSIVPGYTIGSALPANPEHFKAYVRELVALVGMHLLDSFSTLRARMDLIASPPFLKLSVPLIRPAPNPLLVLFTRLPRMAVSIAPETKQQTE